MALVAALLLAACGQAGRVEEPVILWRRRSRPTRATSPTATPAASSRSACRPIDAGRLPDPNGVRVQFTSVEGTQAVTRLSVYVVNTGRPMTPEAFAEAVNSYQPPEDVAGYE